MKWLIALLTSLGLAVGVGFAAVAHHHSSPVEQGWTLYVPLNQTDTQPLANYLPARHSGWFPALAVFPVLGAIAGLALAVALANLGFRLSRAGTEK